MQVLVVGVEIRHSAVPAENVLIFDPTNELLMCADGISSIFELIKIKKSGKTVLEYNQAKRQQEEAAAAKSANDVADLKKALEMPVIPTAITFTNKAKKEFTDSGLSIEDHTRALSKLDKDESGKIGVSELRAYLDSLET